MAEMSVESNTALGPTSPEWWTPERRERLSNDPAWREHLKAVGKGTRFKKGSDPRREGARNISDEQRKRMADHMRNIAKGRTGPRSNNWRGGITPEIQSIRNSPLHHAWALSVYEKDHYTCQVCGERCRAGNIVAHHVIEFRENKDLRFDIGNGITMCRKCHKIEHGTKNAKTVKQTRP